MTMSGKNFNLNAIEESNAEENDDKASRNDYGSDEASNTDGRNITIRQQSMKSDNSDMSGLKRALDATAGNSPSVPRQGPGLRK